MKIETTPFQGVASQDSSEMSREERVHRLWMTGYQYNPLPTSRIWTKSEAIKILQGINELSRVGTQESLQKVTCRQFERVLRRTLGFTGVHVIEDPKPGDFL